MAQDKQSPRIPLQQSIQKLLGNSALPATVPTLPAFRLNKLVQTIGKEDAQELLVYATAAQISELVETDVWDNAKPGSEEKFSAEKFLEWIELWRDIGTPYLTRRLRELGSELLSVTLQNYMVVVDIQEVGVLGSAVVIEDFALLPKDEEHWPTLYHCIVEVCDEDPEFIQEVLAQCCRRRSLTVEKTHIAENENLLSDVEARRDQHRRDQGYVTQESAAALLYRFRNTTVEELIAETAYDPFTAMQLRRLERQLASFNPEPVQPDPADDSEHKAECEASPTTQQAEQSVSELIAELLDEKAAVALLAAPEQADESYLEQQLAHLERNDPAAAGRCRTEIIYLANMLLEGGSLGGSRLSDREAMECVSNTCNLGLLHCELLQPESLSVAAILSRPPGLIKAFAIAYRLTNQLASEVRSGLERVLRGERLRKRLRNEPWLNQDLLARILQDSHSAQPLLLPEQFDAVLNDLQLVCNPQVCAELQLMGDALPRFPQTLAGTRANAKASAIHVNRNGSFFSTPDELQVARDYLQRLDELL